MSNIDTLYFTYLTFLLTPIYVIPVYMAAEFAKSKDRSFWLIFFLGLFLTPLISGIVVALLKNKSDTPDSTEETRTEETRTDSLLSKQYSKYYSDTGLNILFASIILSFLLIPVSFIGFTVLNVEFGLSRRNDPTWILFLNMVLALLLAISMRHGGFKAAPKEYKHTGTTKEHNAITNTETITEHYRQKSKEEMRQEYEDYYNDLRVASDLKELGVKIAKHGWNSKRIQTLIIAWSLWAIIPLASANFLILLWLSD